LTVPAGSIVETGPTDLIFDRPAHPYTEALLSAIPVPRARGARSRERIILKGDLPSPLDPPAGCKFSTRCPIVGERCGGERPQLRPLPDGRRVACHFPRQADQHASARLQASDGEAPVENRTSSASILAAFGRKLSLRRAFSSRSTHSVQ
jgi:oligopeptide/dipeptide ABC transporter ATP-binding protein